MSLKDIIQRGFLGFFFLKGWGRGGEGGGFRQEVKHPISCLASEMSGLHTVLPTAVFMMLGEPHEEEARQDKA